ncbi:hypothetical protein EUGRSUZ_H04949 [Eucalyptus grandis]|uniref:Uncharacterized protein n=2 Tax=Eucalyptus grandis TaxID=71139 RepID=A0ACC3JZ45_EUCGR|nr:hypothetical protein EUGRSUZ_H04949 [Eucalyptus grandis]
MRNESQDIDSNHTRYVPKSTDAIQPRRAKCLENQPKSNRNTPRRKRKKPAPLKLLTLSHRIAIKRMEETIKRGRKEEHTSMSKSAPPNKKGTEIRLE